MGEEKQTVLFFHAYKGNTKIHSAGNATRGGGGRCGRQVPREARGPDGAAGNLGAGELHMYTAFFV